MPYNSLPLGLCPLSGPYRGKVHIQDILTHPEYDEED